MIPVTVNNRPFASDYITGLMMPDGIFEASLGRQQLNAHFSNTGTTALSGLNIYIESTSHPGISVTPATHSVASLKAGTSALQNWEVNVSNAPAGKHYISFIAENASGRTRIIKRIFVTRVTYNAADQTFSAETPEGTMKVSVKELLVSDTKNNDCGCTKNRKYYAGKDNQYGSINQAMALLQKLDMNDMKDCPPQTMLIKSLSAGIEYNPAFEGQYGELPYQDPWWKTLLAVLAIILFIAAVAVVVIFGTIATGGAAGVAIVATLACCSVPFFVAVGLAAGALVSAIIASAADHRDPFRRGQDNTLPGAGERTTGEKLDFEIDYIEPIQAGKPYAIGTKWEYTRITKDASARERSYTYAVSETNNNIHVLSHYEVEAPDVVKVYLQKKEPFIVKARFYDQEGKKKKGTQLYVKCFLQRKSDNRIISFTLEDNGLYPDSKGNEGTYTGIHQFKRDDDGYWRMLVIAQDVNNAKETMTPDEAAQIIGGQILTHQLTVDYSGGTCPLVPDGEVHVIA